MPLTPVVITRNKNLEKAASDHTTVWEEAVIKRLTLT